MKGAFMFKNALDNQWDEIKQDLQMLEEAKCEDEGDKDDGDDNDSSGEEESDFHDNAGGSGFDGVDIQI